MSKLSKLSLIFTNWRNRAMSKKDYPEYISQNFKLSEMTKTSFKNVDNSIPNDKVYNNLVFGCRYVLQPVRDAVHMPIIVTSGYRCQRLNSLVGGVKNSAHMEGRAADIRIKHLTPKTRLKLYELLRANKYTTQVLWEKNKVTQWLHVSWEGL